MMTETTRRDQLLRLLKKHKKMTNNQLKEELFCSSSTLRRELLSLEKEGVIRRYRGGVVLEVEKNHMISSRYRENVMVKEKEVIAEIASTFIGPGMSLFLDSSSTVKALTPYLSQLSNCVIVTNGLKIAYELLQKCEDDTKIFMVGGEAIKDAESVIGEYGNSFLDAFHFDLCILSCTGIDEDGLYEANYGQSLFKKGMMIRATEILILVDDTKFDNQHAYKLGELSDVSTVITNKDPGVYFVESCQNNGTELLF